MKPIIDQDRSVIVACDVELPQFEEILEKTSDIPQVGGYKIGAILGLAVGLRRIVEIARRVTAKPLIYDHQKAGTDIPEIGKPFIEMLKNTGIDAFILFPLAGPAVQVMWTSCAHDADFPIIVGGHMTHDSFLVSQGGYIADVAVDQIFSTAARNGVTNYVVPGNKPDAIASIRALLTSKGVEPTFYSPGFITQGGRLTLAARAAGPSWHAIVGRAIYQSRDIRQAALDLTAEL